MTESIASYQSDDINDDSVQCSLCLHEINFQISQTQQKPRWVLCPRCGYKQLTSKTPRIRDLIIFGSAIGIVYIATVVAVLLVR